MHVRNRTSEFFGQIRHDEVVAAIREAERKTSGEIRVFISRRAPADPVEAAKREFGNLALTRTAERNGVLIFIAPKARSFAVIGDRGVHERCGDAFWAVLAEEMAGHFRKAEFQPGLLHAIAKAGRLLAEHFPRRGDDRNELPDRVAPEDR